MNTAPAPQAGESAAPHDLGLRFLLGMGSQAVTIQPSSGSMSGGNP